MLYLSFKFVRKFKFCVSPLVKRYPADSTTQLWCMVTQMTNNALRFLQ